MANIFLYAHGGSGNHGCEAIVRSTKEILGDMPMTLISSKPEEDCRYGIDDLCPILKDVSAKQNRLSFDFLKAYAALKLKKDYIPMDKLWYKDAFSHIHRGDIAMSIGGDNYCYADVQKYVMLHDMLKARGAKTVLWGCSVEPDVANKPEIRADLQRYDLITARETITYETLKAINPNTVLVADPAFLLDSVELPLPEGFADGNTVGINLSPMAIEREPVPGMAMVNYRNLIRYIIENTNMQVALIPHVVWEGGDDRIPLGQLYEDFKDSGRVVLLPDNGCREQKGYIARCRFFIGARTHATIAAYSSGVPTLVVGYSVKARGIARDIFSTEEEYVLPVQNLTDANMLVNVFQNFIDQEGTVRQDLLKQIAAIKDKASAIKWLQPLLEGAHVAN